jgi:hypothetical protein
MIHDGRSLVSADARDWPGGAPGNALDGTGHFAKDCGGFSVSPFRPQRWDQQK